jgi:hypothetical protein
METTHEALHVDKRRFVQSKLMNVPTNSFVIIFSDRTLEYVDGWKFLGYVGTNAEPPCIEFCNFVHFRTFVNYLSCYC